MSLLQYFTKQLEVTDPSNGYYFAIGDQLEAREQAIQELISKSTHIGYDPVTFEPKIVSKTRDEVEQYVDAKMKEWKEHEGQHLLFFMVDYEVSTGIKCEIKSCWSGEIDSVCGANLTFTGMATALLPRFRQKSPN